MNSSNATYGYSLECDTADETLRPIRDTDGDEEFVRDERRPVDAELHPRRQVEFAR